MSGDVIGADEYRDALSRFASGVTIVTTADGSDQWWGFTSNSFTAVSLRPPLILVCLARDAQCHDVFTSEPAFRVNVLGHEHERLALRFATRGADKFSGGEFRAGEDGLPLLDGAVVSLGCRTVARTDQGDHTILVAAVESTRVRGDGVPAVHADRRYWDLVPRATGSL